MITSFLQGAVERMNMGDGSGNVVLDTGIGDNDNWIRIWWHIKDDFVKMFTMIFFADNIRTISLMKRKLIWKRVNKSIPWMKFFLRSCFPIRSNVAGMMEQIFSPIVPLVHDWKRE